MFEIKYEISYPTNITAQHFNLKEFLLTSFLVGLRPSLGPIFLCKIKMLPRYRRFGVGPDVGPVATFAHDKFISEN